MKYSEAGTKPLTNRRTRTHACVFTGANVVSDPQILVTTFSTEVLAGPGMPEPLSQWFKPCPGGCDEYVCREHATHVFECSCPPWEDCLDAGYDPYEEWPLQLTLAHITRAVEALNSSQS